jgi:hypothetical protein
MANEFKVKNGLIVDQGGATITGSSFITGSLTVSSGITGSLFGSASYAFTASYALNAGGASIDTGSFATTGSNRFIGNQIVTGSLLTSGSNTLIGNTVLSGSLNVSGSTTIVGTTNFSNSSTTITGSFLVSGSTTQIGNNNLLGNTSLSGSLTVSGSQGSTTPTIQIYGDLKQSGYHRFDPVSTNIDTSISASYIYVSGSTQDLYFSQNGLGYANTTRLRWIEGNLYTGLLGGGVLSSTPGSTTFNLSSGSGIIVSLNAVTSSANPFPTIQYVSWPAYTNQPITNSGSAKITYISVTSAGAINQHVVPIGSTDINQYDTQIEIGVVLHLSGSVSTGVYNSPQLAYGYAQRTDDFLRAFGPLKVSGHTLQASGSSPTLSIKKSSGTAYNNGSNYVINPNHASLTSDPDINISKIYRYYISGSTPIIDTGIANAGYTAIDSKQYVDTTTGTLTAVGAGFYSIQRVFWIPNSPTNAFIVYYGNTKYGNLVDAKNGIDTETFLEAPNTAQNGILLGYIIIQGGGTGTPARDLLNASEAAIIQAGLFRNVGGIGSSGTAPIASTLAGLADVSISSPTNGQPLVYNSATSKWENQSILTATLVGNASSATSSSYASTASLAPNYVLNSVTQSMLSPYVLNSSTGSFVTNSQTSSMSVLSSSFASTASSADNFTVRGTLTAQTIVAQTITSSTDYITGSTRFGSLQSNTHQFTGSMSITGSLSVTNGVINNLTSSYAITASYWSGSVLNSTSASYAATAALAPNYVLNSATSSFILNSQTGSFITNSQTSSMSVATASYVLNAISSSYAATAALAPNYVLNSSTSSMLTPYVLTSVTSSMLAPYVLSSNTSSFITNSQTSSMSVLNSRTASYVNTLNQDVVVNGIIYGSNISASVDVIAQQNLKSLNSSGDEGGEIFLNKSVTNTTLVGGVTIDIYQNRLRFFEQGGSSRGFYLDISSGGASVTTNLQGGSGTVTSVSASGTVSGITLGGGPITGAGTLTLTGTISGLTNSNLSGNAGITNANLATPSLMIGTTNIVLGTTSSLLAGVTSITATSFTGSLAGTSSWSNNSISSSYAATAALAPNYVLNSSTSSMLSPYVLSTNTASFVTNSQTSSFVTNSQTSSMTVLSASFASTASSAENFTVRGTLTAQTIVVQTITSSIDFVTGSTRFGSASTSTHQFTGSVTITGSLAVNGSNVIVTSQTSSMSVATASYVLNAVSSSFSATTSLAPLYVLNSSTSSFVTNSQTGSFATTGSNRFVGDQTITGSINISGSTIQTGSFTLNNNAGTVTTFAGDPFTFARIGNTLSFFAAAGGVGNNSVIYSNSTLRLGGGSNAAQIVLDSSGNKTGINKASPNAALDVNGNTIITGSLEVTIGITGSLQGTSSWTNNSISSSYSDTASLAPNYVLNSSTSSMLTPYVLSTNTGSFITNSQTSSMTVLSASFASTASSAENFTVRGTLTAQTIVVQTITSSIDFVTGSTRFGSASTSTHQFTGSVSVTGSLAVNGSGVILNNQTSSMSVATASYVLNSVSSSFAATASLAPLYVLNSSTSSFVVNSQTSSFATTASNSFVGNQIITGSLIISSSNLIKLTIIGNQTNTGSLIVTGGITGSLLGSSSFSTTASYSTSSSFALSASWAPGGVSSPTFPYTGSAIISGSLIVTGSIYSSFGFTGSLQGTSSWAVSSSNAITSSYALTAQTLLGSVVSASYAATASYLVGGTTSGLKTKSGAVTNTSFTGTPRKATVTFSAAFPNTSYGIVVTGTDLRSWTIESKVAGSFIINTNSNAALTGDTYWVATAYGETA